MRLPYRVFSKDQRFTQTAIVENKRLNHALSLVKAQQELKRETKVLSLCATCYTLRRQDEVCFGGLRETEVERDGHRCRICHASERNQQPIIVHHRVSGKSVLNLMISLCPACHVMTHRTRGVIRLMPPLLPELWREQHPDRHEQTALNFSKVSQPTKAVKLFSVDWFMAVPIMKTARSCTSETSSTPQTHENLMQTGCARPLSTGASVC